jgi:phosphatidate phosphatase APP1
MDLRQTLGQWMAHADRLHAAGRQQWLRLSPLRQRWVIEPYMGFGTPSRLHLRGRVLRRVEYRAADAAARPWRNLAEFWKRMHTYEAPGARVRARLGAVVSEAVADQEGHFRFNLAPIPSLSTTGWHRVGLELSWPQPPAGEVVRTMAQVLVPATTARFGVISDIDDTIVWSGVRRKLRMLTQLARSNAHTRKPFKGVAAFYRALHQGVGGDEGNPIFYVSSSPWNLYAPLVEFLSLQGLPMGPVLLRDFGHRMLFTPSHGRLHKRHCIEHLLTTHPDVPFVLIGDSGEHDPEIYRDVVHGHPGRVRAIYIRSVDPDPARLEAIDRLIAEVQPTGVQLVLATDSEFAAAHAAAEGLIAAQAVAEVREDKRADARSAPT